MGNCFSCVWLCMTPQMAACQAPLSMGFSKKECWSGLPCPPLGNVSDPEIKLPSLRSTCIGSGFFTTSHLGSPLKFIWRCKRHRIADTIWKRNKARRPTTTQLQEVSLSDGNHNDVVRGKRRHIDQRNAERTQKQTYINMVTWSLTKDRRGFNGAKSAFQQIMLK